MFVYCNKLICIIGKGSCLNKSFYKNLKRDENLSRLRNDLCEI